MLRRSSGVKRAGQPARLELVLQPQALLGVRHVRELGADRARVDEFELRQDVAQLHPLRHRVGAAAGEELGVQVGLGQAEVLQVEHARPRPLRQSQRIDLRQQMAAVRPDLDEARDRRLLGCVVRPSPGPAAGRRRGGACECSGPAAAISAWIGPCDRSPAAGGASRSK